LAAMFFGCGSTGVTSAPRGDGGTGSGGNVPDGGTPGPPPVSTCAGIAPPAAAPMMQYVQNPWYGLGFACGGAAADSSGTLAFVLNGAHGDGIQFVSRPERC
jgi:hypothetical protein